MHNFLETILKGLTDNFYSKYSLSLSENNGIPGKYSIFQSAQFKDGTLDNLNEYNYNSFVVGG